MLLQILQVLLYIQIHINSSNSVKNRVSPSNQTSKMIERLFQGKNKSKNSQSKNSSLHSILPGSLESSKQYIKTRLARHIFSSSADTNIQDDQPDPGPLGANGVSPSLRQLLSTRAWCIEFREFLKSEYSEENVEFFTDVETFKNEDNPKKRFKLAKQIFYAYIKSPDYSKTLTPQNSEITTQTSTQISSKPHQLQKSLSSKNSATKKQVSLKNSTSPKTSFTTKTSITSKMSSKNSSFHSKSSRSRKNSISSNYINTNIQNSNLNSNNLKSHSSLVSSTNSPRNSISITSDTSSDDQYLSIQGSKELNLDSWMKKLIKHDFEQCLTRGRMNLDIFDSAQTQIFNIMQKDSFPRFCKSKGLEPPNQDYLVKSNSEEPVGVCNCASVQQISALEKEREKERHEDEERLHYDKNQNNGTIYLLKQSPPRPPRRQSLIHKSPSKFSLPAQSKLFSPEKKKNKAIVSSPKLSSPRGKISLKSRQVEPRQIASRRTEPHQTEPRLIEPRQTEPRQTEPRQAEPRQAEPRQTEPRLTEPLQTDLIENEPRKELQSVTSNKLQLYQDCNRNEVEVESSSSSSDRKTNVEEVFQKQTQMKLHRQGSKRTIRNTIMNGFGRLINGSRQRAPDRKSVV